MADLGVWWREGYSAAAVGDTCWHTASGEGLYTGTNDGSGGTYVNLGFGTAISMGVLDAQLIAHNIGFSTGHHRVAYATGLPAGSYRIHLYVDFSGFSGSNIGVRLFTTRNSNAYIQSNVSAAGIHSVGGSPDSTGYELIDLKTASFAGQRRVHHFWMDITIGSLLTVTTTVYVTQNQNISWAAGGGEGCRFVPPIIQRLPQAPFELPPAAADAVPVYGNDPWIQYKANTAIPQIRTEEPGVSTAWDILLLPNLGKLTASSSAPKAVSLGFPVSSELNTLTNIPSVGAPKLVNPIYVPENPAYVGEGNAGIFGKTFKPSQGERRFMVHKNNQRIQR